MFSLSFSSFFLNGLCWDTSIIQAVSWGVMNPAQQTLFPGGLSLFLNNSFGLKDRRSPTSLRTEGQVGTGEAAAAEKQLTFTNSVSEAIR